MKTNTEIIEELWMTFKSPFGYSSIDNKSNSMYDLVKFVTKALEAKDQEREKAVAEAKQEEHAFFLNVLDGVDIADGQCNTKAIRLALKSRTI